MSVVRMGRMCAGALVLAMGLLGPHPAAAQQDAEGAKDHPLIQRIPGYHIYESNFNEFEKFKFEWPEDREQTVEGKHWTIGYMKKEGARRSSIVEIYRNYKNAFQKQGARTVAYIEDWGAIFQLKTQGGEMWCWVRAANDGDEYRLEIVERAGMAQVVDLNAGELAKALDEKGSVAIYGILFDTGKATIKPESAAVLATVGELLKSDAALTLEIQGHTDNAGQKAANQLLSQQRADAVRQYLVTTLGIAAGRLTSVGFGDTRPVASNDTDAGRQQNRRVELAKK